MFVKTSGGLVNTDHIAQIRGAGRSRGGVAVSNFTGNLPQDFTMHDRDVLELERCTAPIVPTSAVAHFVARDGSVTTALVVGCRVLPDGMVEPVVAGGVPEGAVFVATAQGLVGLDADYRHLYSDLREVIEAVVGPMPEGEPVAGALGSLVVEPFDGSPINTTEPTYVDDPSAVAEHDATTTAYSRTTGVDEPAAPVAAPKPKKPYLSPAARLAQSRNAA